jgi:hypothetical protein
MWWIKLIGAYLFGTGLGQVAASLARLRGRVSPGQPFQVPPVATGTPIPVLYGTMRVRPIVTWLGAVASDPVYDYDNPKLFGIIHFAGPQQIKVAYSYRVTLQGVLCWGKTTAPINVVFGDRRLLSNEPATQRLRVQGPTTSTETWLDVATSDTDWFAIEALHGGRLTAHYVLPNVFGGIGRGGGFGARFNEFGAPIGTSGVTFAIGSRQYGPDPTMQRLINPDGVDDLVNNVPDYGDLATVVYDDVTVGEGQTPPPVDYVVARFPDHAIPGLFTTSYGTVRSIQYGPGPAWNIIELTHVVMLFDAMRSSRYGAGMAEALFDGDAWAATAATLFSEGIYGSILLGGDGRQGTLGDLKDEVEKVVDGQLVRNPVTGLHRFTLNRDEASTPELYDALPAFDERHLRLEEWHEAQPHEVINQVTIEFFNAEKLWALDSVVLTNEASVNEIGLRPTTIRYQSITDRAVAFTLCARELRRASTPLARGKAKGTRIFWSAERGNVFKLTNTKRNLNGLVVRIAAIDYGAPESGEIQMDLVEDLFGNDNALYRGPETPPVVTLSQIIRPAVTNVRSALVGTNGQLTITLVDPQHRVIEVAFNRQVGDGDPTGWTVVATATPNTADPTFPYNDAVTLGDLHGDYVATVARPAVGTSSISYRVRYVATGTDDIQEILGESEPFESIATETGGRGLPPTITLSYTLAGDVPTITATVSPGVVKVRFATSIAPSPAPDLAAIRAGTVDVTAPFQYAGPRVPVDAQPGIARAQSHGAEKRDRGALWRPRLYHGRNRGDHAPGGVPHPVDRRANGDGASPLARARVCAGQHGPWRAFARDRRRRDRARLLPAL